MGAADVILDEVSTVRGGDWFLKVIGYAKAAWSRWRVISRLWMFAQMYIFRNITEDTEP